MKTISSQLQVTVLGALVTTLVLGGCGGKEQFASGNKVTSNAANVQTVAAKEEPPSQPGKYGGSITDDSISDPKTFNLWVASETSSTGAVGPLYDTLLSQNPYSLKWEGHLAELPKVSSDGLTWTFQLKPNLKWSDGAPITADDIIFTLDVIYDPKVQTNMRESMQVDVEDGKGGFKREPLKYRKVDERTVEFKFPVRYAPARNMLNFPIAPKHKLGAAFQNGQPSKTQFNSTWGVDVDVSELVSSGPWVLQSYAPGQRLVYARNPNYWKKDKQGRALPYLDKYITLIVPDTNTSTLKFRSGETDVMGIQHTDYPAIKRDEAKGDYRVLNLGPTWGNSYLCFNQNPRSVPAQRDPALSKLFADTRFRQAASFAIDRDRIGKTVFLGFSTPMYGPESPANTLFYNPDVAKYPYDVNKARQMLAQLGLKDTNGNGILEVGGKDIKFNILTNVENKQRVAMATIISDSLRKAGLGANFTPIQFNKLVSLLDSKPQPGQPYPSYDWQAIVLGFTGGPEPNDGRSIWSSSGNLHQWYPYQDKPATAWEKDIDGIFRTGAQEMDETKRKALYARWQKIASEQMPLIYTVVPDGLVALRNKYGNVKPCSLGGVTWNIEELYQLDATRDTP